MTERPFTVRLLFLLASALCFLVALLEAVGTVQGADASAWGYGGALALVLALAVP